MICKGKYQISFAKQKDTCLLEKEEEEDELAEGAVISSLLEYCRYTVLFLE
jgi:hypothetical protein